MSDEPRLEIIKLPDLLGAEWRAVSAGRTATSIATSSTTSNASSAVH